MSAAPTFKEVGDARYDEMLGVLLPALWIDKGFLVGEPFDHRRCKATGRLTASFSAFICYRGKYYESEEAMTVAVRTSLLSCRKAGKTRIFTPVRGSSGESRIRCVDRKMTRNVSIAARLTLSLVCLGFAMSSAFSQAANQQPLSVRPLPFIAGGTAANIQDYPWQVAILTNQFHEPLRAQTCGGSIIYDRWVLTSAHCVTVTNGNAAVPPNQIDIVVGTATFATGGQRISIDRIVVHPQWNRTTGANDIALLHTSSLLQGANVLAADLADSTTPIGGDLVVSGWGATSVGNQGTAVLQRVMVPYVSNATCNAAYHGAITITTGMMCAGFQGGGKGACHGDSGGPLVIYGNGPRRANGSGPFAIQVGIVSWSQPNTCAAPNAYMVYTRVSEYRSWISNTTAEVVALIRQDFSDCSNGNVSGGNPAQIGGSVAITRKPNGSINAQVSLTHGTANTSYHFFLKCVHILGDVHTNGQGSGSASFDFPSNLVGNQFAFDMYPEGAPLGNKYQSVRVTLH